MPPGIGLVSVIQQTIRAGESARSGLAAFRSAGGRVRDATWFRAFAEVRTAVTARESEQTKSLRLRPRGDELALWPTRNASGIAQQVEVLARDRTTGQVRRIPYTVKSPRGLSRQGAITHAIGAMQANEADYDQVILGGVHVGAYRMEPTELEATL
jgi:hypothetical protein